MARLNTFLPDRLEKEFRLAVAQRFGGKKGDIGRAMEAAIREWLENGRKY